MGIRVHKMVGYGLDDLRYRATQHGVEMIDDRVDWKAFRERYYNTESSPEQFIQWMRENEGMLREWNGREYPGLADPPGIEIDIRLLELGFREAGSRPTEVWSCVEHNAEYGLPNVLVLIPLGSYRQWFRFDDTLDYEEETRFHDSQSRVRRLPGCGIFPYNSNLIRFRGADKEKTVPSIPPSEYAQLVGTWDPKLPPLASGETLEHLKNDFRPKIPLEVIALALWSGIFRDPRSILDDLRPMLYVCWR